VEYHHFSPDGSVSRETFEKLSAYAELILKWQKQINLISPRDIPNLWDRHILDAWQLVALLQKHQPSSICDLGSGGGLPGIVLAIAFSCPITLIESDRRKIAFLETVCAKLQLFHVKLLCQRIEETVMEPLPDIITARACADLTQLLNWSEKLLSPKTICVFPKGKNYAMELEEAQRHWSFSFQSHISQSDHEARILELWDISQAAGF
jgi:16S rRNA (guanine527-N7)-methyltransferase